MKNLQITILSLLFLAIPKVYSQEYQKLNKRFPVHGYCLDRNQVQYNPSKDFIHEVDTLGGKDVIQLRCIISKKFHGLYPIYYNHLISKDRNFIAYIIAPPIYCEVGSKDSIYIDPGLVPERKTEINNYHLHYIKIDFWQNTGEKVSSLQNFPINYKSSKYANEAFNADTVITYPLKMWDTFKNEYNHCQVMLILKKRRGFIALYCLYNDKGARKLNRYFRSLEKVFWYRNPKDYIEFIEPKVDSIYVIPHLKKNN